MPVNAAWLLNAYPDAYICAQRIKLAFPLINGALPFALPLDLALGVKPVKHVIGLILGELAKLHELRTFDGAMLVDVGQRHLLLLDRLVASLADIGGLLPKFTVNFGAQRVRASPACPLRLDQPGFDHLFERCAAGAVPDARPARLAWPCGGASAYRLLCVPFRDRVQPSVHRRRRQDRLPVAFPDPTTQGTRFSPSCPLKVQSVTINRSITPPFAPQVPRPGQRFCRVPTGSHLGGHLRLAVECPSWRPTRRLSCPSPPQPHRGCSEQFRADGEAWPEASRLIPCARPASGVVHWPSGADYARHPQQPEPEVPPDRQKDVPSGWWQMNGCPNLLRHLRQIFLFPLDRLTARRNITEKRMEI